MRREYQAVFHVPEIRIVVSSVRDSPNRLDLTDGLAYFCRKGNAKIGKFGSSMESAGSGPQGRNP